MRRSNTNGNPCCPNCDNARFCVSSTCSANAMRDSHMAALVDVLLTLPRLTYLDVSSNQFRVSTLQRLVDDNRLRVISATNTSLFGDGKLDSFVRSLQSNTSLFSLGVSECSLMPEEGIALVTYLRGSHTLQELSIHGSSVGLVVWFFFMSSSDCFSKYGKEISSMRLSPNDWRWRCARTPR
jgi:hypothetical protein